MCYQLRNREQQKVVVSTEETEREMKMIRATSRQVRTLNRRSGFGESEGRPRGGQGRTRASGTSLF